MAKRLSGEMAYMLSTAAFTVHLTSMADRCVRYILRRPVPAILLLQFLREFRLTKVFPPRAKSVGTPDTACRRPNWSLSGPSNGKCTITSKFDRRERDRGVRERSACAPPINSFFSASTVLLPHCLPCGPTNTLLSEGVCLLRRAICSLGIF